MPKLHSPKRQVRSCRSSGPASSSFRRTCSIRSCRRCPPTVHARHVFNADRSVVFWFSLNSARHNSRSTPGRECRFPVAETQLPLRHAAGEPAPVDRRRGPRVAGDSHRFTWVCCRRDPSFRPSAMGSCPRRVSARAPDIELRRTPPMRCLSCRSPRPYTLRMSSDISVFRSRANGSCARANGGGGRRGRREATSPLRRRRLVAAVSSPPSHRRSATSPSGPRRHRGRLGPPEESRRDLDADPPMPAAHCRRLRSTTGTDRSNRCV